MNWHSYCTNGPNKRRRKAIPVTCGLRQMVGCSPIAGQDSRYTPKTSPRLSTHSVCPPEPQPSASTFWKCQPPSSPTPLLSHPPVTAAKISSHAGATRSLTPPGITRELARFSSDIQLHNHAPPPTTAPRPSICCPQTAEQRQHEGTNENASNWTRENS